MTIEHETTEDEIDRLLNDNGEIDARMVGSGNPLGQRPTDVPPHKCEAFKRLSDTGRTLREINAITDSGLSLDTISFHVRDECKHRYVEETDNE